MEHVKCDEGVYVNNKSESVARMDKSRTQEWPSLWGDLGDTTKYNLAARVWASERTRAHLQPNTVYVHSIVYEESSHSRSVSSMYI